MSKPTSNINDNDKNNSQTSSFNKGTILNGEKADSFNDSITTKFDLLIDKMDKFMENQEKFLETQKISVAALNSSVEAMNSSVEAMNRSVEAMNRTAAAMEKSNANQEILVKYILEILKEKEEEAKKNKQK